MLILVAVTISMAVNGGLFDYAGKATGDTNNAMLAEQQLGNGGITVNGTYYSSIDEYLSAGKTDTLTLGDVYKDEMIGQPITYSANGQTSWIVFGKDKSGNILITTKLPIDNGFELYGSAEKWLTYENDLHTACSGYGGTIQGQTVTSRSITMEDINYVAGFTKPTFETFTFGSTHGWNEETEEWDSNNVNYYYPSTSAADNSYWQDPTIVSGTFENDWYGYYNDWDPGEYWYCGADTDWEDIPASERNIKTENLKYIWGGNTEETCYNAYLVASHSVEVSSFGAVFYVAEVGYSSVDSFNCSLCGSSAGSGDDNGELGSFGVRPIVVLPSNLLVEEQSDGTYDLAGSQHETDPGEVKITFTVNGTQYEAVEGQTWGDWVEKIGHAYGFYVESFPEGNFVRLNGTGVSYFAGAGRDVEVEASDFISSELDYEAIVPT